MDYELIEEDERDLYPLTPFLDLARDEKEQKAPDVAP